MKDKVSSMRVYLDIAKSEWNLRLQDDAHVDAACQCLAFSIELGLKHLITLDGRVPPHKHEMKTLLAELPEKYYNSEWYSKLDKWKNQTNTRYNDSRYSDNFSAINSAVEDYLLAADELLLDASNQTSYVCNTETRVKRILNKLNSTKSVSEVIRYLPEAELPESILYDLVIEILQK